MNTATDDRTPRSPPLYPIRTVCSATGVNPVTLRAWERRYGLIKPLRTEKGHRLYTQADIDRINETISLLDKGIPIGQVRQVIDERDRSRGGTAAPEDHWARYVNDMVNAITAYDELRLDRLYGEALSLYPIDIVIRQLIIPLLRTLGVRWETGEGNVAEEHFFGVFLRNKLGARLHHLRTPQTGPRLITACLPGEQHEVGLLLFAITAKALGYQIIMLGANMPLEELPTAAKRSRCDAIVLSGSRAYDYKRISRELKQMAQAVHVPVFIGGSYSITARDLITAAGAIPVGEDMTQALKHIDAGLEGRGPLPR